MRCFGCMDAIFNSRAHDVSEDEDSFFESSNITLEWCQNSIATYERRIHNVVISNGGHYRMVIKNKGRNYSTNFNLKGTDSIGRVLFEYEDITISNDKFSYEFVVKQDVRVDVQTKLKLSVPGLTTGYSIKVYKIEKHVVPSPTRRTSNAPRRKTTLGHVLSRGTNVTTRKRINTISAKDKEWVIIEDGNSSIEFTEVPEDTNSDDEDTWTK
ncbi:transcription factor che [Acrasis kona]|uniref:Transcription factor che n=1 Tax=Acrasis kona TaxID=1008807 RepID=A0AAW2YLM3_9EUKA